VPCTNAAPHVPHCRGLPPAGAAPRLRL